MPSDESISLIRRALETWPNDGTTPSERQYLDFVSLVTLAVKKAGEPFPLAHSILAQVHFDMRNIAAAWDEATRATTLAPNDFKSQLIKVIIAFGAFREALDEAQSKRHGFWGAIGGVFKARTFSGGYRAGQKIGEALSSGVAPGFAKGTFHKELGRLIQIYRWYCDNQ